ncbi:MAG: STAS domain-containing protein [Ruminococcaceae bacterium]|jgi:anti-sigma B factor antagonist|nr:STAS domain-containing protein [Oscillospiraceae bacterium]
MTINQKKDGSKLTLALEGRLDTTTAPQLEEAVRAGIDGLTELHFDFAELEYISSAGLRVLLSAQKSMNKQGEMVIHNANSDLMDIFEVTGFSDILNIQ